MIILLEMPTLINIDIDKQAKLIKLSQEISKSPPTIKQASPENSTSQ